MWPDRVFNVEERFNEETDKVLEFHYTKILRNIYFLAMDVFAGEGDLTGKQSPWVHQYPNEFYEHVKAIARPDPHGRHWEGLLRDKYERVFLVVGIVMRVLDTSIFSSLMFGASDKHQKALEAHDIDLIEYDGKLSTRPLAVAPDKAPDHW